MGTSEEVPIFIIDNKIREGVKCILKSLWK